MFTPELLNLNISQVEKFNPLTDPTYNHSGIQQENTNITQYVDRIEFFDNRLGKIIGKIVKTDKLLLYVTKSHNDVLLDVELRGEHAQNYAGSLFKNTLYETYLIVRIGDEYLYVSPFSYEENGITKYRLQVLQRKLSNSPLENNLELREGIVYLIAEGSSKDKGFKTSSIYIGDGSFGGFLSYDPYYGLMIRANRIEMVSGGSIGDSVSNTDFNAFKTDVESRFLQIPNQINLAISQINTSDLVKKSQVVTQINLSTEGIKIQGSKISIDGNTTFSADTKFNGVVTAGNSIIIENTGQGKRTVLTGGTITFYEWSP